MGVEVRILVQLPDGRAVPGAQVVGVNHDAWSEDHQVWKGTTDSHGQMVWENLDRGTLGDRYTFSARSPDVRGENWTGEVSDRIRGPRDLVIVLHKGD